MSSSLPSIEIWKPVVGYEGLYEVSSLGRVHRVSLRGRPITPRLMSCRPYGSDPYVRTILTKGGECRNFHVHALVCEAFHGHRPAGMWVRHLDGNRLNNSPANLAWGTPAQNMQDQVLHGTRITAEVMEHAKLDRGKVRELRMLRRLGWKQIDLAKRYGVAQATIWSALAGKTYAYVEEVA